MRDYFSKSYDYTIASDNSRQCSRLIDVLRNEVYVMQFEAAQKNLNHLEDLLNATTTILDEDSQIPSAQLARDSVLDIDYVPRETMPDLRGPALRAARASRSVQVTP